MLARERGAPLREQDPQATNALLHELGSRDLLELRVGGLELFAIRPDAEAEDDAALAELVQRRHLLREQDRLAHRHHDDAGHQLDLCGPGCAVGICDEDLEEVRRVRPALAHVLLSGHVVVAHDLVVAELLRLDRHSNHVVGSRERNRIDHALGAGRQRNAEFQGGHALNAKWRSSAALRSGSVAATTGISNSLRPTPKSFRPPDVMSSTTLSCACSSPAATSLRAAAIVSAADSSMNSPSVCAARRCASIASSLSTAIAVPPVERSAASAW